MLAGVLRAADVKVDEILSVLSRLVGGLVSVKLLATEPVAAVVGVGACGAGALACAAGLLVVLSATAVLASSARFMAA